MTARLKHPWAAAAVFIWIGFVCAISFMEAWLKFQAPGITVELGLGIGKLVFSALNKVEWVLAIIILLSLILKKDSIFLSKNRFYFIPLLLLILQTVWLLPVLNSRALLVVDGQQVAPSNLHLFYVGFEIIKTVLLIIFGTKLLKR